MFQYFYTHTKNTTLDKCMHKMEISYDMADASGTLSTNKANKKYRK